MKWRRDPMWFLWWLVRPLFLWVKSSLSPLHPRQDLTLNAAYPILYVLPKRSLVDLLVLYYHCRKAGLPRPKVQVANLSGAGEGAYHYLAESGLIHGRKDRSPSAAILKLLENLRADPKAQVQVIPVTCLWGKYPGTEERSLVKLLFTDDENAGILQKFLIVLAQGRRNMVLLGQPLDLRELVDEGAPVDQTARKLQRVLRVHFQRQRTAVLGQKLFNREQVIRHIIAARPVEAIIELESKKKLGQRSLIEARARAYAQEITADLTFSAVRFAEIVLSRLWKKIFAGVDHRGIERVRALATDHEVIYMPTHRSHLDYLLMTYIIYANDLPISHTAAGNNLDFWPVGWFIRRMGGFFLRRSFGGNRLYAAVFSEYLHYLITHGYPFTFFPEGGRSRSGRLLAPKTGMLSMVVQSYMRSSERPVALVPVYIGYDKVVEVRSYRQELSGGGKRKESFFHLLKAVKFVRNYYGKAYVGFGEPVLLRDELQAVPDWHQDDEQRQPWVHGFVQSLAKKVATRTNAAAIASSSSMIGLALLSTPQRALPEEDLIAFVETLAKLLKRIPYGPDVVLPEGHFAQNLRTAERLKSFQRFQHAGGDVIHLSESDAIVMSYYKNNIIHLYALPALVARFFQHQEQIPVEALIAGAAEIYPYLEDEFYLPWSSETVRSTLADIVKAFTELGLTRSLSGGAVVGRAEVGSAESSFLAILGNALGLAFERYTITTALLAKKLDDGFIETKAFEQQCQKIGQRLMILSGINTHEAVDKALFASHIKFLRSRGLLELSADGTLLISPKVRALTGNSMTLLSPDMRAVIERITSLNG